MTTYPELWVEAWRKKNSLSLARFNVNTSKPSPHSTHKKIIKNKKRRKIRLQIDNDSQRMGNGFKLL